MPLQKRGAISSTSSVLVYEKVPEIKELQKIKEETEQVKQKQTMGKWHEIDDDEKEEFETEEKHEDTVEQEAPTKPLGEEKKEEEEEEFTVASSKGEERKKRLEEERKRREEARYGPRRGGRYRQYGQAIFVPNRRGFRKGGYRGRREALGTYAYYQ